MGRCCRCGCEKINFKVFDFTDGSLLWQDLLERPTLSTAGLVYHEKRTPINAYIIGQDSSFAVERNEIQIERYNTAGVLQGTSPIIWVGDSFLPEGTYLSASHYRINDSGDYAHTLPLQPNVAYVTDDSATENTYYFLKASYLTGSVVLSMNSTASPGTYPTATWSMTDTASTVESAILFAFASYVTSVTVTGASFADQLMIIQIEWNADHYYLTSVAYPSAGIGNTYRLLNLHSGVYGTIGGEDDTDVSTSSRYEDGFIWQDNGNLLILGCEGPESVGTYDATEHELKSFDTSTDPWTLDWYHQPFIAFNEGPNDRHPYGSQVLHLGSKNGRSILTCPVSMVHDNKTWPPNAGSEFTTFYTYDDAGNWNDNSFAGGSFVEMNLPDGCAVEDGGTKVGLSFTQLSAVFEYQYPGVANTVKFEHYGQITGDATRLFSGTTGAPTSRVNRGDWSPIGFGQVTGIYNGFAGCTGSAVAMVDYSTTLSQFDIETLCSVHSRSGTATTDTTNVEDDGIDTWVSPAVATPVINPTTLTAISKFELQLYVRMPRQTYVTSSTDWRLRIEGSDGTNETFGWYDSTTTAATVNADLLAEFGSDAESNPIVEVTANTTPTGQPLFNRDLKLFLNMVRTTNDDHTEYGLPDWLGTGVTTPTGCLDFTPNVSIEFQDFGRHRTKQLGALNWHDGSAIWSRNFGKNGAQKQVLRAALHDGLLHVLGAQQCAESLGGITLGIAMVSVGDSGTGWTVTVTLTVTNTRPNAVTVANTGISVAISPSTAITWTPASRTIAAGANATFSGQFATFAADTFTATGTATGTDDATAESLTTNEATDTITLT